MPVKSSWTGHSYYWWWNQWKARATKTLQLLPDASPAGFLACQTPISLKSAPLQLFGRPIFGSLISKGGKKSLSFFLALINVCSPLGHGHTTMSPGSYLKHCSDKPEQVLPYRGKKNKWRKRPREAWATIVKQCTGMRSADTFGSGSQAP